MSEFSLYYGLGLDHILDINGYDHILFVIALSCLYQAKNWKAVLTMVTAFTIGHSLTLALATLNIISVNSGLIEFLIPVTILFTSISNLFLKEPTGKVAINSVYAGVFGLIHGMGFSNYLRSLLGAEDSILLPLFAFNVGLEVGQIIIVVAFMIVSSIAINILRLPYRDWKMIISSAVGGIAITLMLDAVFW